MKPWHEDVRRYFTEHLIYDESSDSLYWSDGESVTIITDDYGNKTFNIGRYTFYVNMLSGFFIMAINPTSKLSIEMVTEPIPDQKILCKSETLREIRKTASQTLSIAF